MRKTTLIKERFLANLGIVKIIFDKGKISWEWRNEVKKGGGALEWGYSSSIARVEAGKRGLGGDLETLWRLEALVKRLLMYYLERSLEYQLWIVVHRSTGSKGQETGRFLRARELARRLICYLTLGKWRKMIQGHLKVASTSMERGIFFAISFMF